MAAPLTPPTPTPTPPTPSPPTQETVQVLQGRKVAHVEEMSRQEVIDLAKRVNDLFTHQPMTQADAVTYEREYEKLKNILEGRKIAIAGGEVLSGTIDEIRDLAVVQHIAGQSKVAKEMLGYTQFFGDSKYCNTDLDMSRLGGYLVGRNTKAVVLDASPDGGQRAAIDAKKSLIMDITPEEDGSFTLSVMVPPGKKSEFGGVTTHVAHFDSWKEAQAEIESIMKKAKAMPAEEALRLAKEYENESPQVNMRLWENKFPRKVRVMTQLEAEARAVDISVQSGRGPGKMRYLIWKTCHPDPGPPPRVPEYYITVCGPNEKSARTYRVKSRPCPNHLLKKKPCPITIELKKGERPVPLTMEDKDVRTLPPEAQRLLGQEERLKEIFGMEKMELVG